MRRKLSKTSKVKSSKKARTVKPSSRARKLSLKDLAKVTGGVPPAPHACCA